MPTGNDGGREPRVSREVCLFFFVFETMFSLLFLTVLTRNFQCFSTSTFDVDVDIDVGISLCVGTDAVVDTLADVDVSGC